jgi:hypothetical protein
LKSGGPLPSIFSRNLTQKSGLTPENSQRDVSDRKLSIDSWHQKSVLGRRSPALGSEGLSGVIIRGNSYRADLLQEDLNPAIGGLERYAMSSQKPSKNTTYAGMSSAHLKMSALQEELSTPMKSVIQHRGFFDPAKLALSSMMKAMETKKNNNIFFADQNFARAMSNGPNGIMDGPGLVDKMINYEASFAKSN